MDDAEAEAVLRALVPPLKWRQTKGNWAAYDAERTYRVLRTSGLAEDGSAHKYFAAWFFWSDTDEDVDLVEHPRAAAAKAACERHFTTGKWE